MFSICGALGYCLCACNELLYLLSACINPLEMCRNALKNDTSLFQMFVQSISEHKPLVEKLNKTGEALIKLCNDEEGGKVQDILDADNARYAALRSELRQRQQALEHALQVCLF
jgi:hypothetical protein